MPNTHSATLNGSSQYFTANDSASLSPTGNMTLEIWVKLTNLPGTNSERDIISKTNFDVQRSWRWRFTNSAETQEIRLGLSSSGSNNSDAVFTYTAPTNTWTHLAMVYTAATPVVEFYVNGVSQGTAAPGSSTSIFNSTSKVGIGQAGNGDGGFHNGLLDEPRVWNTARTASQISANYNISLTGSESGLQAYWPLNNALTDATANSNTLTNVSSATFTTDIPFTDPSAPVNVKTWNGLAIASVKTVNGLAIASVKTINGLA